jgi:transketolase
MTQGLKEARKICLKLSNKAQDGNLQSAFSSMEIIWTLQNRIMNSEDILILSKGQSTLALYSVLVQNGTYFEEDFNTIGQYGSRYSIQADMSKHIQGISNSAGALGHGLPFACGRAMAKKVKKEPGRVFVLTGDGEFNEGTMWESCLIAERFKLDNLWIIVDDNQSHDIPGLKEKFTAFDLFSQTVPEGNNPDYLKKIIDSIPHNWDKAKALIVRTQRGYGCPSMMTGPKWFHRAPNNEELVLLSKEVDEQ